ncbi:MAG: hypothetical protein QN187_05735 [Armatimonadota bacterium]|nr:hypothetical protein [Armatimonadota bacterium]MDR7518581.1 hypothetical protein [Armatimonadota bacterium]MDR7549701.1 hypothetical protein [Armatimonadota bacterium]
MSLTEAQPVVDLRDTPVVTVDLDILEANIRRLQRYCDAHGIANRPHIKTHNRAGTYVFNDRATVAAGAILDAGSKTLSSALAGQTGHGRIAGYPDAVIARLNEEHGTVDLSACRARPEVGEIVSVIPNHTCVVTNLHDRLAGGRHLTRAVHEPLGPPRRPSQGTSSTPARRLSTLARMNRQSESRLR